LKTYRELNPKLLEINHQIVKSNSPTITNPEGRKTDNILFITIRKTPVNKSQISHYFTIPIILRIYAVDFIPQFKIPAIADDNNLINFGNNSITNLESQIDIITIPEYISGMNNRNDSITNLQYQIDRIAVPDYATDINCLNNSITDLQEHFNSLIRYPYFISGIEAINDSLTNLQEHANGIVMPPDHTSKIYILH
jgi:hypothetical protein